jgi:molybdenum cofactor synthesis domain-containing protein|tara:strand:+ start:319 stop:807 length:489 start_codon:yes stop_codon:yes gene_type:complete
MKYSVITISDSASSGENSDVSGPLIIDIMGTENILGNYKIVPDEQAEIVKILQITAQEPELDLILTTGGTGIGPRDVTPEATREVIEYEIPGISELMRVKNYVNSEFVALSRAVVGVTNKKLIINLPGNPKAVKENLNVLIKLLPHALDLIKGNTDHKDVKR